MASLCSNAEITKWNVHIYVSICIFVCGEKRRHLNRVEAFIVAIVTFLNSPSERKRTKADACVWYANTFTHLLFIRSKILSDRKRNFFFIVYVKFTNRWNKQTNNNNRNNTNNWIQIDLYRCLSYFKELDQIRWKRNRFEIFLYYKFITLNVYPEQSNCWSKAWTVIYIWLYTYFLPPLNHSSKDKH